MSLSLFNQFLSPSLMWALLAVIALTLPWALLWMKGQFTQQMFLPINNLGHKWALLLASLMLFLVTLNTAGLLPFTFTPTTQLSVNMGFAVPLWLATVILGMWTQPTQPTQALGHLLPEGTPTPLIPILIVIETISLFTRPLALGVRLTANLTAGHLLIQLISSATSVLLSILPAMATFTITLLSLLTLLEVAVAMIQAYVFVLLLSLYLQENV